jgi:hypothetical protein
MKITVKETFEKKFAATKNNVSSNGSVDYLKFLKNNTYSFLIVPKVISIDIEKDEVEIDYPFEEVNTHFGLYDLAKARGLRIQRINCKGCVVDKWLAENKVPKSVWKTAVPTKFFNAYVIHEKKIKIASFQDYLYVILLDKISKLMTEEKVNLIDVFRHRVRVFTNAEGRFDVVLEMENPVNTESAGYMNVLNVVNKKPLDLYIEQNVCAEPEYMNELLKHLKDYTQEVIDSERDEKRREKMQENTDSLRAAVEGFKKDEDLPPNKPVTDSVTVNEEDPF